MSSSVLLAIGNVIAVHQRAVEEICREEEGFKYLSNKAGIVF